MPNEYNKNEIKFVLEINITSTQHKPHIYLNNNQIERNHQTTKKQNN